MPLRFATNSIARFSSVVSMDWDNVTGKPNFEALYDPLSDFDTISDVQGATIPATVNYIRVAGYAAAGDGGRGNYKRGAQPSHDGKIQSADGAWWELDESQPNELMFGGVSSRTNAQQTAAILSLFEYCDAYRGRKATIVATHTITETLAVPAALVVEFAVGSNLSSISGGLIKGFNGDMITMGNGAKLIKPFLGGAGATFTGRGIVIDTGADQVLDDPTIINMDGACLEFPTGGAGIRFRCFGGLFNRTSLSSPAIVGPASELTTTGFRMFVHPYGAGQVLFGFNNGHMWIVNGGASGGLDYTGNTSGQTYFTNHRLAGNMTVNGLGHHFSNCSITGDVTIAGTSSSCSFVGNVFNGNFTLNAGAADHTFVGNQVTGSFTDNSGVTSNRIGVTTTATQTLTNKTLSAAVASGTWTTSGTWTLPALTLGGTVSGGNNQVNDVIIGTTNPRAGSFTSMSYSTTLTGTSSNANALAIGPNGTTNPVLKVDASTASQAAGLSITGAATGGTVEIQAIDSGVNANLRFSSKGSGSVSFRVGGTTAIFCSTAVTCGLGLFTASPTGGLGYSTGAGGTVTQATSKSTGVTRNTASGEIIMNNASLASNTSVMFTLTNSVIAATDTVIVNIKSGATSLAYLTQVEAVAAGSCNIVLRNISGGSLSEAVVLTFNIIKGVTS